MSGLLTNAAVAGRNRIVAHDDLSITDSGSLVASGDGAFNSIRYRRAARPPVVEGLVEPAPSLLLDGALAACAVCGDGERSERESCDDGNVVDGDGCSSRCRDEGCEAATPGYPAAALCDDANVCTDDLCDGHGACAHSANSASCEDRDFCSVGGVCVDGSCQSSTESTLVVASLRLRNGGEGGGVRGTAKVEFPSGLLAVAPSDTSVRVVLLDPIARPLVDTVLPAGSFRGAGRAWRFRAAADSAEVGVVKAAIEADSRTGLARARLKLRGLDPARTAEAGTMSLALLLGVDPGTSPCTSSGDLACERDRSKFTCASAP